MAVRIVGHHVDVEGLVWRDFNDVARLYSHAIDADAEDVVVRLGRARVHGSASARVIQRMASRRSDESVIDGQHQEVVIPQIALWQYLRRAKSAATQVRIPNK